MWVVGDVFTAEKVVIPLLQEPRTRFGRSLRLSQQLFSDL